jgi:hypothetical protein
MAPTPTPAEDEEIIAKANALLAKDAAAYFADQELQEATFEALERQAAPEVTGTVPPPAPSGDEIERRIGRQDMQRYERMMRERPGEYWASPQHQAAYRDAIQRATAAPPEAFEAPATSPDAGGASAPAAEPSLEAI